MGIENAEAWPFEDGAEEVVVRVSRYAEDGVTPVCYQAIAKSRDRTKVWGVGIGANPVLCIERAISEFHKNRDKPWPSGGLHGISRSPLLDRGGSDGYEMARAETAQNPDHIEVDDEVDDEAEDMLA